MKKKYKQLCVFQIKNNRDKIIVLCSNKIHKKKEEGKHIENNSKDITNNDKGEKIIDNGIDRDKEYYCFDCNNPIGSDCICINDDYSNCEHNNEHSVFNIEVLNEMKLF